MVDPRWTGDLMSNDRYDLLETRRRLEDAQALNDELVAALEIAHDGRELDWKEFDNKYDLHGKDHDDFVREKRAAALAKAKT